MSDLISRQAAIDAYGDWYVEEGPAEGFIGTVKQLLEGLPSAQQWNVITKRPMDEDERKEFSESLGYDVEDEEAYIYSNLPGDGEEVIICSNWGAVKIDTFRNEEGCYFEDNGDMDGIVAWMPKPEPYKEG